MTVRDNLMAGAYLCKNKKEINEGLAKVYALFPRLKERENQDPDNDRKLSEQLILDSDIHIFVLPLKQKDEPANLIQSVSMEIERLYTLSEYGQNQIDISIESIKDHHPARIQSGRGGARRCPKAFVIEAIGSPGATRSVR
jgi:hypothetical protein